MVHEGVGQSTMELSRRRHSAENVIQQKGVTWQGVHGLVACGSIAVGQGCIASQMVPHFVQRKPSASNQRIRTQARQQQQLIQ